MATYVLRDIFDWGTGCIWAGNDAARDTFGLGPLDQEVELEEGKLELPLPLRPETLERARHLGGWHDGAMNWEDPTAGAGPWRQEECDRFNAAARDLLATIRSELGSDFEILDHTDPGREDPDYHAVWGDGRLEQSFARHPRYGPM